MLRFNLTPPRRGLFSAHEKDFVLAFDFRFRRFRLRGARAGRGDAAAIDQIVRPDPEHLRRAGNAQDKRIDALEKQVNDLQDKLNQPAANNFASTDDLKKLADQVQELAKKQQDDNDVILKELEKFGKGVNVASSHHAAEPSPAGSTADARPRPRRAQSGYYYEMQGRRHHLSHRQSLPRQQGIKVIYGPNIEGQPRLEPEYFESGAENFYSPAPVTGAESGGFRVAG